MPKKIILESFIHHLATYARTVACAKDNSKQAVVMHHIASWHFDQLGSRRLLLSWTYPSPGKTELTLPTLPLYTRGDTEVAADIRPKFESADPVLESNKAYFSQLATQIISDAFNAGAP